MIEVMDEAVSKERQGTEIIMLSGPETEYAADFVMSFGTSIFAPKAKITKD